MHIKEIKDYENFQVKGKTLEGNVEFYITISDDSFIADFFNKNQKNSHIETLYLESEILEEAIEDAKNYILD